MQTRFATTGLSLLRRSLGEDLTAAAKDGEEALTAPLPVEGAAFAELRHVVFLGDKWSAALCQEAALKIREAAGFWTEAYPLFEYQHGPISCAGPQSLVWAFCDVPDWVAADIEATGARLEVGRLDPQAELVRVHRLAVELALREGRDPDRPPHLSRSVTRPSCPGPVLAPARASRRSRAERRPATCPCSDDYRGQDMEPIQRDQSVLQLIAEGVTELAGFEIAAIGVVRDGFVHTVAVAGDERARAELAELRTPVDALMAELEHAEEWGLLRFVPHEREAGHLDDYSWIPDLDVSDAPGAWHPRDLLCALLYDDGGTLRGLLSIDMPSNGLRPGPDQQRILQLYASQAARAVITALERSDYAEGLERERAVAEYRAQLMSVLSHEVQNPLTVILQNAELLLTEGDHDELTVHGLEAIQRGARRIEAMGRDLLVLARVGKPDRPLDDVVDLVRLARGVVELLGTEADNRRIGVDVEAARGPAGGHRRRARPRRAAHQPGGQRDQVLRARRPRAGAPGPRRGRRPVGRADRGRGPGCRDP